MKDCLTCHGHYELPDLEFLPLSLDAHANLPDGLGHVTYIEPYVRYLRGPRPPKINGFQRVDTYTFKSLWPECSHRIVGWDYDPTSGWVEFFAACQHEEGPTGFLRVTDCIDCEYCHE